jgi:hypothetical protein
MRIASWSWGGRHHVGRVSPCGTEATPWALPAGAADAGVLPVIQAAARGEGWPEAQGTRRRCWVNGDVENRFEH